MDEDLRLENAQLKEQLRRIRQVCEIHRKMGEDTEFEVRELKRKLEELKKRLDRHVRHYGTVSSRLAAAGDHETVAELELSKAALQSMKDLLSRI